MRVSTADRDEVELSCPDNKLPPVASSRLGPLKQLDPPRRMGPLRWMGLCLLMGFAVLLAPGDARSQSIDSDCAAVSSASPYDRASYDDLIGQALRNRWIVSGSVVAMDRVRQDPLTLMQSTTNSAEQLNAADIDFGWQLGIDVSLMRKAWDDTAFEVRYLDLGELTGSASIPVSNSQLEIITSPPVFVPAAQGINARFATDFFSFETNYYYPMYDFLDVLIGFRYVSFDDDIFAEIDAVPGTVHMLTSTTNDLYGGQIGAITRPCQPVLGCLWLSAYAKAGVYGNDAENRGLIDTGVSRLGVNDSADDTSFMGEFGATSTVPIGERISIFASYSLIWLESVAIASEQIAVSDYFNGVGSSDRGNALFYGGTLGVELRF